jgi:hypothetical protein
LVQFILFLVSAAGVTPSSIPPRAMALFQRFAAVIAKTTRYQITNVTAANRKQGRRNVARLTASLAIAFERFLSRTHPHRSNETYAPLAADLIRYVMKHITLSSPPLDDRWSKCYEPLLAGIENPDLRSAVRKTYRQIIKAYRLRRVWVMCLTFPILLF